MAKTGRVISAVVQDAVIFISVFWPFFAGVGMGRRPRDHHLEYPWNVLP